MSVTLQTLDGRYELRELVGSGGMADVYRAEDLVLQRSVAVKVLRSASTTEGARARFAGEARTLAGLNHPGLVTILDAGIDGESPFLVMELVSGPTLARQLADHGPLTPAQVAGIGAELASALAYAHADGVVHRDVKPSNILVHPDDRVVLTDFGIARLLADTDQHTLTGETIGSPAYLAPEQVTGAPLGTAVDVYALGLVLIEALAGARAYPGPPIEAAVARLTAAPIIPVSLDSQWRDLLVRMTQRDPADRPSALEVAGLLGAVPEAGVATTSFARVSKPGLAAETVALTGVLDLTAPSPARRRPAVLVGAAVAVAVVAGLAAFVLAGPDQVDAGPVIPSPSSSPSAVPSPAAVHRSRTTTKPAVKPPAHAAKPVKGRGKGKKHGRG